MFVFLPAQAAGGIPEDKKSAVILSYYRVNEDIYPHSNVRLEQFKAHIDEIKTGQYTVMPVAEIITALKEGRKLPPRTLGITFEGGFKSVLKYAAPLLVEAGLPFTVFYASEKADQNNAGYLNWKDLKRLAKMPDVTLGIMPDSYEPVSMYNPEENKRRLNKARKKYRHAFNHEPALFAYPYGAYTQAYQSFLKEQNFLGAFSLQSGPVHEKSDFLVLPRFTMTERYGDLDRFKIVTRTLPLPVYDIEPADNLMDDKLLNIGFSFYEDHAKLMEKMNCYSSGQGKIGFEILGGQRVEIRPDITYADRIRINCTVIAENKSDDDIPAYRWLGFLFFTSSKNHLPDELPEPPE